MSTRPTEPVGGFNVEKAILQHIPDELKAAEKEVATLERKLDAARERVYRLRNIAAAVGYNGMEPEETTQAPAVKLEVVAREGT
ncbi:MAG: hypothetical protein A3E78_04000 [Alphaproteobacteria bacterium RIFCSPHIGHO2_12_FULL_63_12]|nr:MAG: hypothetical protein A3E78_04000 [Alphaproteobacteria bacterium RIFCSPHIGHO2_12_FULL_63_12]